MVKLAAFVLLSLILLFVSPTRSEALNTLCPTKGVQLYTTNSEGKPVGPAKNTPYNIEVRYPQIKAGSSYTVELKLSNSGRVAQIAQGQATEVGKLSLTGLQFTEENLGPYLITFSESNGGANTPICDSSSFMALAKPLSAEEIKNLQTPGEGCKSGDADCTSAKGIPCGTISGSRDFSGGIETAIGCVPTQPQKLIESLLRFGTFAGGGIAFLLMIFAALQMITAEGNPNTIKTSQERFYSAIIGLLLIIFSVLLLQVIGFDLLGLKGFGR